MSKTKKSFEVRVIEEMLVTYEVEAYSEDEITDDMFIQREDSTTIREVGSEYFDFDRIYDIEESK